jgi:hypothetical protein
MGHLTYQFLRLVAQFVGKGVEVQRTFLATTLPAFSLHLIAE